MNEETTIVYLKLKNEKGQKCLVFLYSDRNVGLLFKCEEAGVIIQYAGY